MNQLEALTDSIATNDPRKKTDTPFHRGEAAKGTLCSRLKLVPFPPGTPADWEECRMEVGTMELAKSYPM